MNLSVSIIICTCNRADSLRETLASIGRCEVPTDLPTDLIVVDNGSTDHSKEVVEQSALTNMHVRYTSEPRKGKGYAYNTGISEARGDVFLFTDDDVKPSANWVSEMCAPLLRNEADITLGTIKLSERLQRKWMQPPHRACLAESTPPAGYIQTSPYVVGASMGFTRDIIERLGGFDVRLGPGALGFGDDLLIGLRAMQMRARIFGVPSTIVEHDPGEERLMRGSYLDIAKRQGRTGAYLSHHWGGVTIQFPRLKLVKNFLELAILRAVRYRELICLEGSPLWEMRRIANIHRYAYYIQIRHEPRIYK